MIPFLLVLHLQCVWTLSDCGNKLLCGYRPLTSDEAKKGCLHCKSERDVEICLNPSVISQHKQGIRTALISKTNLTQLGKENGLQTHQPKPVWFPYQISFNILKFPSYIFQGPSFHVHRDPREGCQSLFDDLGLGFFKWHCLDLLKKRLFCILEIEKSFPIFSISNISEKLMAGWTCHWLWRFMTLRNIPAMIIDGGQEATYDTATIHAGVARANKEIETDGSRSFAITNITI